MSPYLKDLLERVVRTFVAAALVVLIAGWTSVTSFATAWGLAGAAGVAGLTAVLGLAAKVYGDPTNASFFKPAPPTVDPGGEAP